MDARYRSHTDTHPSRRRVWLVGLVYNGPLQRFVQKWAIWGWDNESCVEQPLVACQMIGRRFLRFDTRFENFVSGSVRLGGQFCAGYTPLTRPLAGCSGAKLDR